MSLELAAKHLAAKGRGPDTELVHMTMGELESLQALAKAHGGTLTVNPDTGLPEAGFLSSILPMVAGIALGPAGLGLTAMQAGLAAGGIGALATGSLRKGMMAGLGAYGGAGLAGGLLDAGAAAAGPQLLAGPGAAEAAASTAAKQGFGANLSQMGRGLTALTDNSAAREAFMSKVGNAKGLMRYGAAAAAPIIMAPPQQTTEMPGDDQPMRYTYNPGRVANPELMYTGAPSGERTYFRHSFTRMADGGVTASAFDRDAEEQGLSRYSYDPVKQKYTLLPRTATQMPKDVAYAGQGLGGDTPQAPSAWSQMTPTQQAAYYAANPTMATITQMGQKAFGMTTPGSLQKAMAPDFVRDQQLIAQGIDPVTGLNPFGAASPAELAGITAAMNMQGLTAQGLATQGLGVGYDPGIFGDVESTYAGPAVTGEPAFGYPNEGYTGPTDSGPSTSDNNTGGGGTNTTDTSDPGFGAAGGGLMALAGGGYSHLGDYSDGGRLLRGPGDGVSDSIPATIGRKRPARLADGEFVVPARIVSELGNGSTEAGARKLYAMMDRIQKNRRKSIGKGKVAVNSRSEKLLPA